MYETPSCPECKSGNIFLRAEKDEYECLSCGHKWTKKKVPVEAAVEVPEETWLIRDKTFVKVEGRLEEPLETPKEIPEEKLLKKGKNL